MVSKHTSQQIIKGTLHHLAKILTKTDLIFPSRMCCSLVSFESIPWIDLLVPSSVAFKTAAKNISKLPKFSMSKNMMF